MRIRSQFGRDTGMYVVDVYLESDREAALSPGELFEELRPLLAAQQVDAAAVVDYFLHRRGTDGEWVSAGQLPADEQ